MTDITHLTPVDYARQPWKNGGGTTTEIARRDDVNRWLWRLSIADVDRSGPFSDFAGYRRIIVLLEGRGMTLSFDRAPRAIIDHRYRPFAFDGSWRAHCALLGGPIRDMNLIVDDARIDASLDVHALDDVASLRLHRSDCTVLHAIAGRCQVAVDDRIITLAPADTLRIDNVGDSTIAATAIVDHAVLAHAAIEHPR